MQAKSKKRGAPATKAAELPVKSFRSPQQWSDWLAKNHGRKRGLWLRFFRKHSQVGGPTYAEALDEALCHGWIDGRVKKYDDLSWIQKFTPRGPKSVWSKRNIEHVKRLKKAGRMTAAGMDAVALAQADGRWDRAYDPPSKMKIPEDFLEQLSKNKAAHEFFLTLNRTNTYAIAWRLQTAKRAETRLRRMTAIIEMLARQEKFH